MFIGERKYTLNNGNVKPFLALYEAEGKQINVPVGPVAAVSPWNFPAVLFGRRFAAASGAGCSIIIKPSEEALGVAASIVAACQNAGVPDGVLNRVFGDPVMISDYLIRSPIIAKVSRGLGCDGEPQGFDAYCTTRFVRQCNMGG